MNYPDEPPRSDAQAKLLRFRQGGAVEFLFVAVMGAGAWQIVSWLHLLWQTITGRGGGACS